MTPVSAHRPSQFVRPWLRGAWVYLRHSWCSRVCPPRASRGLRVASDFVHRCDRRRARIRLPHPRAVVKNGLVTAYKVRKLNIAV